MTITYADRNTGVPMKGSVTLWIDELKDGNRDVATAVWDRYFERLVRVSRAKLRGSSAGSADEEDVALNVLDSFFRAAAEGRFPRLADRDGLWRLLVRMAARKVIDQKRYENRLCRGAGRVLGEDALALAGHDENSLAQAIARSPTPEFAAIVREGLEELLGTLQDEELKQIVLQKLDGHSNHEIAQAMDCSIRTIERRLMLVREICRQRFLDG